MLRTFGIPALLFGLLMPLAPQVASAHDYDDHYREWRASVRHERHEYHEWLKHERLEHRHHYYRYGYYDRHGYWHYY